MPDFVTQAANLADDVAILATSGQGYAARYAAIELLATALREAYRAGAKARADHDRMQDIREGRG